jgi:sugar transferase (PEP-CTERM/EpsH1 system associated)
MKTTQARTTEPIPEAGRDDLLDRTAKRQPPLVVHIICLFAVGGLETGLRKLINHMPADRYRHAIVCLTDSTNVRNEIHRPHVPIIALARNEGHGWGAYVRLWQVLRRLRPDIVHTRNLAALECLVPAALAGVPCRIHGEHGHDIDELNGSSRKYRLLRRVLRPLVHQYTAVSADLAGWLVRSVGLHPGRVTAIYNGVDSRIFHPRTGSRPPLGPDGFAAPGSWVVGTVGRMEPVKDQPTLVRAFLHLLSTEPSWRDRLRLVLIGEGSLRDECRGLLRAAGAEALAWLPGERADVPPVLRAMDLFVLPSLGEGMSNAILEAMATGLPVVATKVGGNPELVEEGRTGTLVPSGDPVAMAGAIRAYLTDPDKARRHGQAGRRRVEAQFSLDAMVEGYLALYDAVLSVRRRGGGHVRDRRHP